MNHETTFLRQITADDVAVVQLQLVGGTFVMVTINSQVRKITNVVLSRGKRSNFKLVTFTSAPAVAPRGLLLLLKS